MRIAVFASGSGSNFQAIVEAANRGEIPGAVIALLVVDKPGCGAVQRAINLNIPFVEFEPGNFASKSGYEEAILRKLSGSSIDLIALAGYMRLVGSTLLGEYEGRIVNLHPSLLPAFPGKNGIGDALAAGVSETGVTVHFIDSGIDTGPIIEQSVVKVNDDDDLDSLATRIHAAEHQLYPKVLADLVARGVTSSERSQL